MTSRPPTIPSRENVDAMFDRIARRYDFTNRFLSMRQDMRWRKTILHYLPSKNSLRILDLASGTADVALILVRDSRVAKVYGIDIAGKMLALGRQKIRAHEQESKVHLALGNVLSIPFEGQSFDCLTMAFGIRNVPDVKSALKEMYRVCKPDGRVLILEFSLPPNPLVRRTYLAYFRHILPVIGGMISGDKAAYRYLNKTVETFPYGSRFCELLTQSGFRNVRPVSLTFGIATLYIGER